MNEERRERGLRLRVGVFVLAGVVALVGMIYLLGARARLFEARYTIHADFVEVGGLTEGATVRLAGVQIGRVTGVHLPTEPGGKVRVDLTIASQYSERIRKDSIARIETQGLLGDRIVEVTVGTLKAPAVKPGEVLAAREAFDIGQIMNESAQIVRSVGALADSLRETAQTLNQSRIIEDAAATVATTKQVATDIGRTAKEVATDIGRLTSQATRIVEQVEKGSGWAHALVYEEPVALRKVNELVASTQAMLDRIERGEGALGVLTSAESTAAAKRLVAAMERVGRMTDRPAGEEGLLPALLFDPAYKSVLEDLRAVSRNFREVSDRLVGGRGTLGSLIKDEPEDGGIRQASQDLQAALANLKEITEKINEGEGTIGALIADPSVYERLVSILDGAQRSFLLRSLIRGLGDRGREGERRDGERRDSERKEGGQRRDGGERRDGEPRR